MKKTLREVQQNEILLEMQMAMLRKLCYLELVEWTKEYCRLERERMRKEIVL